MPYSNNIILSTLNHKETYLEFLLLTVTTTTTITITIASTAAPAAIDASLARVLLGFKERVLDVGWLAPESFPELLVAVRVVECVVVVRVVVVQIVLGELLQ